MQRIEVDSQDRSRAEELVVADLVREVAQRQPELRNRKAAGLVEADERSARLDESLERGDPGVGEPADIFGRHDAGQMAGAKLIGGRRRQDDRVVSPAKAARADLGVVDARERKLILFQQPPRPSFVGVLHPRFVQRDAGPSNRLTGAGVYASPGGSQPEPRRDAVRRGDARRSSGRPPAIPPRTGSRRCPRRCGARKRWRRRPPAG